MSLVVYMLRIIKSLKNENGLWYEFCTEVENSSRVLLAYFEPKISAAYYKFLLSFFIPYLTVFYQLFNSKIVKVSQQSFWDKLTFCIFNSFTLTALSYLMILSIVNFKRKRDLFTVRNFFKIIYGFLQYIINSLLSFFPVIFLVYDFGLYAEVALKYLADIFEFASATDTLLLGVFSVGDSNQLVQELLSLSMLVIFISLLGIYTILSFSMTGTFLNRNNSKEISKWLGINILFSFLIVTLLYTGFIQAMNSDSIVKFKSFRVFNYAFALHFVNVIIICHKIEKAYRNNLRKN